MEQHHSHFSFTEGLVLGTVIALVLRRSPEYRYATPEQRRAQNRKFARDAVSGAVWTLLIMIFVVGAIAGTLYLLYPNP